MSLDRSHPNRHHLFWLGLYLLVDLSWIRADQFAYWHNSFSYDFVAMGSGCAPEQYRIGALLAAQLLVRTFRFHSLTAGFVLVDLLSVILLSLLLYELLLRQLRLVPASLHVAAKAFLGLWMLVFLHATQAFTRVETLPNCVFVALGLLLLGSAQSAPSRAAALSALALLLLCLVEGWVRADVAIVLAVSLALAAGTMRGLAPRRRLGLALTGVIGAAGAGATLLYLMRVLYPAAHYCGPVSQFPANFIYAFNYLAFLTMVLPLVPGVVAVARRFGSAPLDQRTILLAAALYLVLWTTLGNWSEARIYVPFAMGLLPASCIAMARLLTPPPGGDTAQAGLQEPPIFS